VCAQIRKKMLKRMASVRQLWLLSGMRYKVKAMVGLYQCITAVPTVYNVDTPEDVKEYTNWFSLLDFEFGFELLIPGNCFQSYRTC
jgi:hypothetical protein